MSKSIFDHCKEGNEQGVRECLAASRVAAIIRTSDGVSNHDIAHSI